MASLCSSSFSGSLQVRSISRRQESPSVFLRIRFQLSKSRIFLACAYGRNMNERRGGQSWSISNRLPDPFSGWSGVESEGGGNSQGKGERGGMLGAGLAGLLLFGGLTFAALSLRSRSSSGVKQQMKPLTTEHEVLLTSDDQSAEIAQGGNGTSAISSDEEYKMNDHISDSVTGINKDPSPSLETCDVTEDKHDIISVEILDLAGDGSGPVDSFHQTANEDDMQIETDVNDVPMPSDSNSFPPEFNENNATDLIPDDLNTSELHSTVFSGTPGSIVESAQITNSFDSLSTDYATEQGNPCLKEIVKSTDLLDTLSECEDSSEPLSLSATIQESSSSVDSRFSSSGVNVAFVSKGDDLDGSLLQVSREAVPINTVSSGGSSGSDHGHNDALIFSVDSINIEEGGALH